MSNEKDATEDMPTEQPQEESKVPEWELKTEFAIVGQMKEVVKKTIGATEMELAALQRKLERLQYGS